MPTIDDQDIDGMFTCTKVVVSGADNPTINNNNNNNNAHSNNTKTGTLHILNS